MYLSFAFLFLLDAGTTWLTHWTDHTFHSSHAVTIEANPIFSHLSMPAIFLLKLLGLLILTWIWLDSWRKYPQYRRAMLAGLTVNIVLLSLLNINNAVQAIKTYLAYAAMVNP